MTDEKDRGINSHEECMRDIGLEDECRNSGLDWSYMTHVHWSESMTGQEYARLPAWGNGPSKVSYPFRDLESFLRLASTKLEA
jgi:hypothetical protein